MHDGIQRALLRAEPRGDAFLRFERPAAVRVARRVDELPSLLAWAEQQAAAGGWAVGYVGYEAAPAFDDALVAHPPARGATPLAAFSTFRAPEVWTVPSTRSIAAPNRPARFADRSARVDRQAFDAAVAAIRAAIAAGETYQVNFSFPLCGRLGASASGEQLLVELLAPGEAPYAAWLEGDRFAILSLSPELFFERRDRQLVMRPMKGTRPRGRFPREDAGRAADLAASPKERAENLMIVDLIRNDLGRVATPGSVVVARAFEVERYPTVWQLTSTVTARSAASLTELFRALFPCASITGAPKAATSRFIRELEGEPRGVYCGAIGRIEPGGDARFSVAIRTVEIDREAGQWRYGVGAGITWDSDPAEEWRECLAKARVLDGPPPDFELIETMRWRGGRQPPGVALLDLHLERLCTSARHFDFPLPDNEPFAAQVRGELEEVCAARSEVDLRVRLLLGRDGSQRWEVEPYVERGGAWTVAIGPPGSAPEGMLAFHKTSLREPYEQALRAAGPGIDELLLVNSAGELTEGTRTSLMVQFTGDPWVTPPLESGLLPGVFREHLLRSGQAIEAPLRPEDLRRAHRVRLVNAVRGWIAVASPVRPPTSAR